MRLALKRFLNIRQRPYELFGLFALGFFLLSFIPSEGSIDFQMHDSYFVIQPNFLFGFGAIYFLFTWMLYVIAKKIIWYKWLTWIHVMLMMISIITIFLVISKVYPFYGLGGTSRRYYALEVQPEEVLRSYKFFILPGLSLLVAHAAFLVNILGGLVRSFIKS